MLYLGRKLLKEVKIKIILPPRTMHTANDHIEILNFIVA